MSARPTPRIRVFEGPNGSGTSTLLDRLSDSNVPLYYVIGPNAIEKQLNAKDGLALTNYGLKPSKPEFLAYVKGTTYSATVKNAAGLPQDKRRFVEDVLANILKGSPDAEEGGSEECCE